MPTRKLTRAEARRVEIAHDEEGDDGEPGALPSQPRRHRCVVPSDLAAVAPPRRVMAAMPTDFATVAEAVRGQPCLGHQAVLPKALVNLGAHTRCPIERGRFRGCCRDQSCCDNSDNGAH
jgi:hypothetical protein